MKKLYAYLLYALLGVELVVFAGFFVRGPQGLRNLSDIYLEQSAMQEGLTQLTQEVAAIKQDIDDWNNHPFHREKEARLKLQMARPEDEIFYLT
jgi:cell division protein FtsB